jgi:glutamate transport system permease protein
MSAVVLADALGPRGRRRARLASIISVVVLGGLLAVIVKRLVDKGQFATQLWEPFTDWRVIRFLLGGLGNTLKAAAVAMVLATVLGSLLALGRLSRFLPVRWLAGGYVEFFRAMPLILLIYFCGVGLPEYGFRPPVFWLLVLALVAYNGAVLAEIFRAGIQSLDRGQSEAAFALGLAYWPAMLSVVIPQAARRMVPAIVSQLVTLLKDTSLGYVITYEELLRRSQETGTFYGNPLQALVVAALMYIAVNLAMSRVARRLEVRQRRRFRAGEMRVEGVEELAVLNAAP